MNKIIIETDKPITIHTDSVKPFKKPNSDYYRLDMIVRGVENGKQTETIKADYMSFAKKEAHKKQVSLAKYIHGLFDKEMNKGESTYRKYLTSEISKMMTLPALTDLDHAVLETLQECLAVYDKSEV